MSIEKDIFLIRFFEKMFLSGVFRERKIPISRFTVLSVFREIKFQVRICFIELLERSSLHKKNGERKVYKYFESQA